VKELLVASRAFTEVGCSLYLSYNTCMKNQNNLQKDSIVLTPSHVSQYIYNDLKKKPFKNILDIGGHSGSLSKIFKQKRNLKTIGIDVLNEHKDKFDIFLHKDFLKTTKEDFKDLHVDLIVSNPPFGVHKEFNELYPQLFLEHVIKIFGKNIPVVFIVGHWFLTNSNRRINYIKNNMSITKVVNLHVNTFSPVRVESDIVYFNIKTAKGFDVIGEKKKKAERKYRAVSFNKKQVEFMKNSNLDNFSGLVKKMLKDKFPDFPN
jgi:hypothetical protein